MEKNMERKSKKILTRREILDALQEQRKVLRKYKVKKIGLFGSYAREDQTGHSDIDLLVEFDDTAFDDNYSGYSDNYRELSNFLKRILSKKVDLVTMEMISPYIKPYALREATFLEDR